jgi:hypothetical protein
MRSITVLRNALEKCVRCIKNRPGTAPEVGGTYDALEALDRITGHYSPPAIPPKAWNTARMGFTPTDILLQRTGDDVTLILSKEGGERVDYILPNCDWDMLRLHVLN